MKSVQKKMWVSWNVVIIQLQQQPFLKQYRHLLRQEVTTAWKHYENQQVQL